MQNNSYRNGASPYLQEKFLGLFPQCGVAMLTLDLLMGLILYPTQSFVHLTYQTYEVVTSLRQWS
jgi:hypothetical protein